MYDLELIMIYLIQKFQLILLLNQYFQHKSGLSLQILVIVPIMTRSASFLKTETWCMHRISSLLLPSPKLDETQGTEMIIFLNPVLSSCTGFLAANWLCRCETFQRCCLKCRRASVAQPEMSTRHAALLPTSYYCSSDRTKIQFMVLLI